MNIKTLEIAKFRNITDYQIEINTIQEMITLFIGKNRTGKTNKLNAIYWLFTGKDMGGSTDQRKNIPTSLNIEETLDNTLVDVSARLSNGTKIRRVITRDYEQKLYINGDNTLTLKQAEAKLKYELGLIDLAINCPKTFDIIGFLLNPLYFESAKPSDLRKFIISLANIEQPQHEINISEVEKTVKDTKKKIEWLESFNAMQKEITFDLTTETQDLPSKYLMTLREYQERQLGKIAKYEHENKEFERKVNDYYKTAYNGLEIALFVKGVGENVEKEICYPILPDSKLPFAMGSTSEKIVVGVRFIKAFCKHNHIEPLPILIDEYEVFDSVQGGKFEYFNKDVQIFAAKVK